MNVNETTPLMNGKGHHHSMLSSPAYPNSPLISGKERTLRMTPPSSVHHQKNPRCCRRILNFSSRLMQRNPWCLRRGKYVFEIILANGLLACIFVLVMKVLDDDAFSRWTHGKFATLGNWNLQVADILLVLSYAMTDFLQLRICLSIACISFVIYALTSPIGIMADMGMFNFVMALLNIRHAVVLIYEKRYIEFEEELEQVYLALFARYMTRVQFKRLADISVIRTSKGGVVMKEEGDLVTSLRIVVNGQVDVQRNGQLLNKLYKNEILEAPEWVRTNLDPEGTRFTVGFVTATDVTYIKFTRELLAAVIQEDRPIRSAVLAVLGIRVSELWLRSLDRKVEAIQAEQKELVAKQRSRRTSPQKTKRAAHPGGGSSRAPVTSGLGPVHLATPENHHQQRQQRPRNKERKDPELPQRDEGEDDWGIPHKSRGPSVAESQHPSPVMATHSSSSPESNHLLLLREEEEEHGGGGGGGFVVGNGGASSWRAPHNNTEEVELNQRMVRELSRDYSVPSSCERLRNTAPTRPSAARLTGEELV